MKKATVNMALAILFSLGVVGCSSGSNSQPGISQQENNLNTNLTNFNAKQERVGSYLVTAQQAYDAAQSALIEAQNATTTNEAQEATAKVNVALGIAQQALADANYQLNDARSLENTLSAANLIGAEDSTITNLTATTNQIESVVEQIRQIQTSAQQQISLATEREQAALFAVQEAERVALIETQVNQQLTIAQNALQTAQQALITTQNVATSSEAQQAASQAQTAANEALNAANTALELASQAGASQADLLVLANQANELATQAQTVANNANSVATDLLANEQQIAREEAERIATANTLALTAKNTAQSNQVTAENLATQIATNTENAQAAGYSQTVQNLITESESQLQALRNTLETANQAANEANSVATVSSTAAENATLASVAATQIATLVTAAENNLALSQQALTTRLAREQEVMTNVSFNDSTSQLQQYRDREKREVLWAELKEKNGTSVPEASCGVTSRFACSRDADLGTVMVNYNQAYSGYAVIREQMTEENVTPSNAFLVLNKESDLVTDKALVTDATYRGYASYSTRNTGNVLTRDFVLNVKDDAVTGSVYTTTVNSRGIERTSNWVEFNESQVQVNNGVVGFNGTAQFSIAGNTTGTYQGVFVGPSANEVVGTFETNSSTERANSAQGAFAGSKE